MLSFILGLIPGALGTINGITNAISNERLAKLKAGTDQERIAADERIKALEARRDALINAQNRSVFTVWVQNLLGLCGVTIIAKLGIWDKVVGSFMGCAGEIGRNLKGCETFRTDPLGSDLTILVGATIAFYLVTASRNK